MGSKKDLPFKRPLKERALISHQEDISISILPGKSNDICVDLCNEKGQNQFALPFA